ncbi:MAG: hypothetical protein H5T72_00930 [Actinobacteria bacterium]|nr:hypothetical protein [Actinomycetota bacterium]
MDDLPRLVDRVDYADLFSRALTRVGRGMSVPEALASCAREDYPHAHRDVLREAAEILEYLKAQRGWGSLRALRELAGKPQAVKEMRTRMRSASAGGRDREPGSEVFADFPRIFSLAQRKRRSGFSLEDCVDMAVRELYPHTFRRTREAALQYLRKASRRLKTHELRALRELAEDPELFRTLFGED